MRHEFVNLFAASLETVFRGRTILMLITTHVFIYFFRGLGSGIVLTQWSCGTPGRQPQLCVNFKITLFYYVGGLVLFPVLNECPNYSVHHIGLASKTSRP